MATCPRARGSHQPCWFQVRGQVFYAPGEMAFRSAVTPPPPPSLIMNTGNKMEKKETLRCGGLSPQQLKNVFLAASGARRTAAAAGEQKARPDI